MIRRLRPDITIKCFGTRANFGTYNPVATEEARSPERRTLQYLPQRVNTVMIPLLFSKETYGHLLGKRDNDNQRLKALLWLPISI